VFLALAFEQRFLTLTCVKVFLTFTCVQVFLTLAFVQVFLTLICVQVFLPLPLQVFLILAFVQFSRLAVTCLEMFVFSTLTGFPELKLCAGVIVTYVQFLTCVREFLFLTLTVRRYVLTGSLCWCS
jgi:hypothetical protein